MGDRAVVYVDGASCALYLHWGGSAVRELLLEAAPTMRKGDEDYAQARLIGVAHLKWPGLTGVGVLPPPKETPPSRDYSHGDAGVFVVDPETGVVECFHGYGFRDEQAPTLALGA